MKRKFTKLIAALALLVGLAIPLGMWGESTTVASFSRSGTTNTTSGGTFTATFSAKSGYYQDDSGERYMQILNNSAYWTTTPNSISFAAVIGGGSGNTDLTDPVYVALLDANGNVISGTQTAVTSHITTNTGDNYNITIPATNNVYGVKLSHNKQNGFNVRYYSFSLSYEEGGGSQTETHTLTFNASPANGGTVTVGTSTSGSIILEEGATVSISATPAEVGYAFSSWAVEGEGSSVVSTSNASTTFTMGTEDATLTANFSTVTTYTVTYHANVTGIDDIEVEYNAGTNVTVAENTFSNPNHSFTKWTTNENGTGDEYQPGATIQNISEDIDLYAQWEEVNEVVDVLNREFTGVNNGGGYTAWSNKVGTSGAVYAGKSAGNNNSIQLNSTSPNGFVSTTSGGKVTKVVITWQDNTSNGRSVDVYGSNTAYTGSSDLYNSSLQGTKLGSIVKGTSTELVISGDYNYIGIRNPGNAVYLSEVKITWTTASSDIVATPVISPNGGSFWESQEVSITCATNDATIYYTTNGTDPTTGSSVYSAPFTITATTTVKAFAVKANMNDSEMATAEFTKATAMTVAQALAATPQDGVYVSGIVSGVTEVNTQYHNATYTISDDGTHSGEMTVFRGKYLNGANFTSEDQIQVGDIVVVYGNLGTYQEVIQLNQDNYLVSLVRPEKVATPTFEPAGGTYSAAQSVTIACATDGATIYYTTDGTDPTTESLIYSEAIAVNTSTPIKAFAVVDGKDDSNIATAEYIIDLTPSITVASNTINVGYAGESSTLGVTYQNITTVIAEVVLCNSEGQTATYDWFEAEINNTTNNVDYIVSANEGDARTAYFKVYALDDESNDVYSEIVTVTQAAFVVDYATLPFSFDGGRDDIATTTGLTQDGLDSDYNSSPKLKFNSTNDWVILKINERPGTLTFDLKGNSFGGNSVFKVQTSEDGVTYTDLETYDDLGATQSEEFNSLGENVRYIKWIYTNKDDGNVALGNIRLAKYVAPSTDPYITVADDEIHATADGKNDYVAITYGYLDIDDADDFDIQFCDAEGNELEEDPTWIQADVTTQTGQEGYFVYYIIDENDGDARTTYFKVFAIGDSDYVYSNIVTVSQAAPAITYTLVTSMDQIVSGKRYIIASGTSGNVKAMGSQAANYRNEVSVTVSESKITETEGVYEFVINGPDANGKYTIYDVANSGYLYAAGVNNGENYLKQQSVNNDRGIWTISLSGNAAVITSTTTATDRTIIRYNSGSSRFSCYGSGQAAVYLYKKDNDTDDHFTKEIAGNQWYFIASPTATVPASLNTLSDLYYYDELSHYWKNKENTANAAGFDFAIGKGYLCANADPNPTLENTPETITLTFTGAPVVGDTYIVPVTYHDTISGGDDNPLAGWNLVGNPFTCAAYIAEGYYVAPKTNGGNVVAREGAIACCEGVMVKVEKESTDKGVGYIKFSKTSLSKSKGGVEMILTQQATDRNGLSTGSMSIDNAIVSFNENRQLEKFYFGTPKANIYIPQGNEDYAIAFSEGQGEMPVNFKANENGTYTLTVNPEGVEMNYLHLIDNMTGMDVDLLQTPSYSFEATTNDYESRFRLVFASGSAFGDEDSANASFAFCSNGNWIINNVGEATLQVIDINGRILSSECVNGSVSKAINGTAGVYMLRLINGENVKVQKVVVR